jgi:hypothetical protein
VRHRDLDSTAVPGSLPLVQRSEDLSDRAEGTGSEVGDLHRRQCGRGIGQRAGPAEIVEIMAGPSGVSPARAEAGDRAVHDRFGQVACSDSEPLRHARTETLQHDVGPATESVSERTVLLQVAQDRLLARVQCRVPTGSNVADRVALRALEANHPCSEAEQFPAGEGAGKVSRQVDDEEAGEGAHLATLSSAG